MILYLIIAPTLLKPEVWHELIRVIKIKRFKWLKKYKDVDIEAASCVHNLQYSSVQSLGRIVSGANRLRGETSMGRNAHGAKRLWGIMSFHGAKCPWGEKSINPTEYQKSFVHRTMTDNPTVEFSFFTSCSVRHSIYLQVSALRSSEERNHSSLW